VGDRIVITPSSVIAAHYDMVDITTVTFNTVDNTTTLKLSAAMKWTHLAVVKKYAGDARGHVLDMRAEVTVITRNVGIRGDENSDATMFGGTVSRGPLVRGWLVHSRRAMSLDKL
jgi:hypothetical protein